jgi:protein-tyrosine-phosphatase
MTTTPSTRERPDDDAPIEEVPRVIDLLTVCTGNAARSVMAGYMLSYLTEAEGIPARIVTAGTHTIDGQPMSMRTREALESIDQMEGISFSRHRSRQLSATDLDRADLVIAMEADHLRFIRRQHPAALNRTCTLRYLAHNLPNDARPLPERVGAMHLEDVALPDDEDVVDPAGHDQDFYTACAREVWELCQLLVARL